MHFNGNPTMGDDFMNDLRYSELQRFLCHNPWFKLDDVMIVSNDKDGDWTDPRYRELKNMAKNVGFRWHEVNDDTRIIELKEELERTYNFKFEARGPNGEQHTTVIWWLSSRWLCYGPSYTRRYSMGKTTLSNRGIYSNVCRI